MVAGLPGTGIGGLFYLLASAWIAVRECYARISRRPDLSRSQIVRKQLLLSSYIVVAMWATGELIGRLLLFIHRRIGGSSLGPHNIWRVSILYWALATLCSIYLVMQSMRFFIKISGNPNDREFRKNAEVSTA
jgi:hypothetical protein